MMIANRLERARSPGRGMQRSVDAQTRSLPRFAFGHEGARKPLVGGLALWGCGVTELLH